MRAKALSAAASLAYLQADHGAAQALYEESLLLARRAGDGVREARALLGLAILTELRGDYATAGRLLADSLALAQRLGDGHSAIATLRHLGRVAYLRGDLDLAREHAERARARAQAHRDRLSAALAQLTLADVRCERGDHGAARALAAESLATFRQGGGAGHVANALGRLALLDYLAGDLPAARRRYAECLRRFREVGEAQEVAGALEGLALVAGAAADWARALALAESAAALRTAIGMPAPPPLRARLEPLLAQARATLGAPDQAVTAAQAPAAGVAADGPPTHPAHPVRSAPADALTAREREVARLIAAGCRTDRQLAARLTVTPATAGVHVQHILEKLGLHSRWQIADRATHQGPQDVPETPPARAG